MCNKSEHYTAQCGESEILYYLSYNHLPVKVRIYAGATCFGESVGIRGRFGRALFGQVGTRLGEPGRTIYIYIYKLMTTGDPGNLG